MRATVKDAIQRVEKVLSFLNQPDRSIWSKTDIQGVVDELLDAWQILSGIQLQTENS